jgi:hypothetical protein
MLGHEHQAVKVTLLEADLPASERRRGGACSVPTKPGFLSAGRHENTAPAANGAGQMVTHTRPPVRERDYRSLTGTDQRCQKPVTSR